MKNERIDGLVDGFVFGACFGVILMGIIILIG